MRILLAVAICFFYVNYNSAQTNKTFTVRAGESPMEVLPNEAKYVLPVFTAGTVYLRDGTFSTQQLNYNYLLGEMQFIGSKGDTLAIADPALVKNIIIDTVVFYYDKFYLEQFLVIDSFKLALKQMLVQTPDKVRTGYDAATGSSSITTYESINSNSSIYHLKVEKDVSFIKVASLYLGNEYNHFEKADKKRFLTVFSKKKTSIQNYLKKNSIDFNKEEDLKKLLQYCVK